MNVPLRRNNRWLLQRLLKIWKEHFSDVAPSNKVVVMFSKQSKYRFGSIRLDPRTKTSVILINGKFKSPSIPDEIVDHTLAHELCHYTHGFSSTRERLHSHPHKGGVIDRELRKRRLGYLIPMYKAWVKEYIKTV